MAWEVSKSSNVSTQPGEDHGLLHATGEDAIEFFARNGPQGGVKVLFLNRQHTGNEFRPYDLEVVPRSQVDSEYFTMSAHGVVRVDPHNPSEFVSLGDWWREGSIFNVLRSIKYFKHFMAGKLFRVWRSNVRFRRYSLQRKKLMQKLFLAKESFCSTLIEINGLCYRLKSEKLIATGVKHTFATTEEYVFRKMCSYVVVT